VSEETPLVAIVTSADVEVLLLGKCDATIDYWSAPALALISIRSIYPDPRQLFTL